jgi:DNA-directed RNA polymerase subunit RPC12/RpoP
MPEVTTFFRHCPSCGRRFEIRLVTKELVEENEKFEERKAVMPSYKALFNEVVMNVPTIVDNKEFQYSYRCKHCGHEWSEIHNRTAKT